MKKITVTQNIKRTTEMSLRFNSQNEECAKVSARGRDVSDVTIDIMCDDRRERDMIEDDLKKKKFKPSDGMIKQHDFSIQSRGQNGKWTEHIVLHGKSAEKMLKVICENHVKLPESSFYLD